MTEPLTAAELAALRRLDAEATEGPWWQTGPPWGDGLVVHAGPSADPHTGVSVCWVDVIDIQFSPEFDHMDAGEIQERCDCNMALIAAARNALLRLLDAAAAHGRLRLALLDIRDAASRLPESREKRVVLELVEEARNVETNE